MKSIAHEMVTSFVKTIGLGFLGYGKERGTIVNEPMTANKAFNGVNGANYARPEFNQPMYGGRSDFSRPDIRSYPPASQGQSFSGF
jgi:hypothetical protein